MRAQTLGAILLGLALMQGASAAGPAPRRPNIVLILADDLDARSVELMPKVKSLVAARGASFSSFFVSEPLCCPSRASILTGQYAHNHTVRANDPPRGGFPAFRAAGREASTIATWLHAAGYRTALLGKYLNGYPGAAPAYVPPGWDEWHAVYSDQGSNTYFNYRVNENGRTVAHGGLDADYETDVLAAKAVDLIRRSPAGEQPLFLVIAPAAPHLQAAPAPRHRGTFPDAKAPRVPSFDEDGVNDKPAWARVPPLRQRQITALDRLYRKRLQTLLALDELVEGVVQALDARGALGDTYILFTSDNGFFMGEHRINIGKAAPYEESIRVPLFVRGPGVPAGRRVDSLALNLDLAPTFAEIAGARAADSVDGRSLLPLLGTAAPGGWRNEVLLEFWGGEGDRVPGYAALRTADHLYVEYTTGERELYDLRKDPYELENLIPSAEAATLRGFGERLRALRSCAGAGCR